MISKSTILVAAVAMATTGASAQPYPQSADANAPSTSGSTGLLGAVHGPHPGYYKFRGTQPPTGHKTFNTGDPFETCKGWMQKDLNLNSENMKGNYQLQSDGFLCQAFNTNKGDVVFVSENTDYTWYTIKGNNVGASAVMSLAEASAPAAPAGRKSRKMMQSASAAQVASTPLPGMGHKWIDARVVVTANYPGTMPTTWLDPAMQRCNTVCKDYPISQQTLLGNVFQSTPTEWTCQCLTTDGEKKYQLVNDKATFAFRGSHLPSQA